MELPALSINQPENPLTQYAKALSVKNMMQQGQLQQQEIQQRQIALDDATGMKRALIDANGDFGQYQKNIQDPKYGVSVQGQLSMSNQIMAHQKASYELDDVQLGNAQKKANTLAGYLEPLTELPDFDSVQQAMPKVINKALADGVITPQQAQEFQTGPGGIKSMDDLKMHVSGLQVISDQLKQTNENRKAGIESWKEDAGSGQMVNVDKTSPDFGKRMPVSSPIPVPKDIAEGLGAPELAGKPVSPKFLKEMKDALDAGNHYENYGGNLHLVDSRGKDLKTMGPSSQFVLVAPGMTAVPTIGPTGQPLSYDEKIASTGIIAPVVRAIIEGRQSAPSSFAQKMPYWQNVMNKVQSIDPQWSEQRAELRKNYTVGTRAPEINAINTALGHVGVLNDAIDALKNGDMQQLNRVGNAIGVQIGQSPVTTFQTIVHRVGPEITKAYVGAGGGESERGTTEADFSPNLSPEQLRSNVKITADLLRSKISSLENQWEQNKAPGMKSFQDQFIMPAAKATLQKVSPQGGGGGAKVLTQTQIQQAARDHGVSVQEATRQAQAAGYTVQ